MGKTNISSDELHGLIVNALTANGSSKSNAQAVADALVSAEIDGQYGHGLSRVAAYVGHLKCGKANGQAIPEAVSPKPGICHIDAKHGLAYPAMNLLIDQTAAIAKEQGIAIGAVYNSHHFGQAGYHVERIAEKGLIALAFTNSPAAMAPWGGHKGIFGTNPIAFAAPRETAEPLVIDLSLSVVARGKILVARTNGAEIPEGWARDPEGNPTTDPAQAAIGTMEPAGGAKGAALALMVEILSAALTGGKYADEASSFFDEEGGPPSIGHSVIVIDPVAIAGPGFMARLEVLLSAITAQDGARIPGTKRVAIRENAAKNGIDVDTAALEKVKELANAS